MKKRKQLKPKKIKNKNKIEEVLQKTEEQNNIDDKIEKNKKIILIEKVKENKRLIITSFVILVFVILIYRIFFSSTRKLDLTNFDIERVKRGDVVKTVTANGTINPVNVIHVGTQVSGTIEKIYVDYNNNVTEGQILAEIDRSILEEKVKEAFAQLRKAKKNLEFIKLDTDRARELFKKNYIARVEIDQAENELIAAEEEYKIAEAQYDVANKNLDYAIIKSPVAGVIISRDVDVGQTVAASLSAPTLFRIAEDLKKMQIETSISEADIGMIKINQNVIFDVDAFPRESFKGKIKQIRLNPKTEQNVVTYNVIIEIKNEDLKLLPGMTAYVSIVVEEVKDVLKINNLALKFKPSEKVLREMGIKKLPEFDDKKQALLFLFNNERVKLVVVNKGLSNISDTEIIGESVNEGDIVISDYLQKRKK